MPCMIAIGVFGLVFGVIMLTMLIITLLGESLILCAVAMFVVVAVAVSGGKEAHDKWRIRLLADDKKLLAESLTRMGQWLDMPLPADNLHGLEHFRELASIWIKDGKIANPALMQAARDIDQGLERLLASQDKFAVYECSEQLQQLLDNANTLVAVTPEIARGLAKDRHKALARQAPPEHLTHKISRQLKAYAYRRQTAMLLRHKHIPELKPIIDDIHYHSLSIIRAMANSDEFFYQGRAFLRRFVPMARNLVNEYASLQANRHELESIDPILARCEQVLIRLSLAFKQLAAQLSKD